MFNSKLLAGAAILAGLAGGPAALAASDTDIHGVMSAKLSLSDAIQKAQKQDNGKAIFGKYETKNNAGNYVVTVVRADGKKDTMNVDPQTGQATKSEEASSGSSSQGGAQTIEQAKVGLTEAIKTAEAQGGKAMRATLDTDKGKTAYKIELAMANNKTQTVWVDANSGQVFDSST
jgi:uncharacterized membrane protein YkoI